MSELKLLSPIGNDELEFSNRVIMAPMTRSRAPNRVPNELMKTYYSQRASAGLIISEASQVNSLGIGYLATPGVHNAEQVNGWKSITESVHAQGGKIYCQLWHVGRVSHPDFLSGNLPLAPSAIGYEGQAFTKNGSQAIQVPRAMSLDDITRTVDDYATAAQCAKDAGFDGVEIHAANGYLPNQFLEDSVNLRTDRYGGSIENRARFLVEIMEGVTQVWHPQRVSVRISPGKLVNGMGDSNPRATYQYVIEKIAQFGIGLLHLIEAAHLTEQDLKLAPLARKLFGGILVLNAGYDMDSAERTIRAGGADAIAFGNLFISNPDLPRRFRESADLAQADHSTYYGGGEKGYTDYPSLGN